MGKKLVAAAKSAKQSGMSGSSGPTTMVLPCGKKVVAPAPTESHYEECVLRELLIEIDDSGKSHVLDLTAQRRHEPVAKTVAAEYKGLLPSYDLVVEALSAIDIGAKGKHLRIKAQAFNSSRHTDHQPLHPSTEVGWNDRADNGGVVKADVPIARRDNLQSWLAIWPFSGDRIKNLAVNGQACGRQKPAGPKSPPALSHLAVHFVIFPQEEWTFAIEGTKWLSKSKTTTGDIKRQGDKDNNVWLSKTVTSKVERGDASSSTSTTTRDKHKYTSTTETQVNADGSSATMKSTTMGDDYRQHSLSTVDAKGGGEGRTETVAKAEYSETLSVSQKDEAGSIGSRTYSVSQTDSTNKGLGKISDKTRYKVEDIFSLEVKSAGETATFKPSSLVEDLYTIAEIIKDVGQLFSSVKIGWSYSMDYSLFQGTLKMGWGMRWPQAYQESNRVYYVERFLFANGDITLAEGSIAASIGIQFDKGWLPAGVVALAQVSLKASLGISPRIDYVYRNWQEVGDHDIERTVPAQFEITLSGSANGTARALGYSRVLKGTADAKFTCAAELALSTKRPPSLKASITFDGLTLNGYYEASGREPRRKSITPIKLLEKAELMKEREFWS